MGTRFKAIRTLADMQGALNTLDDERVTVRRLRLTPDVAASAQIDSAGVPTNGDTLLIDDGEGNVETFEFTDGGGLTVGTIEVDKSLTATDGLAELGTAINASLLNITAGAVFGAFSLPLTKDTQGTVGNATPLIVLAAPTLTVFAQWSGGVNGNLTAAAASQTIPFVAALPPNTMVLAAGVDVVTPLTGGSISAVALDVGEPADPDLYLAAVDVLSGAGFFQAPAGAGFSTDAGAPFRPVSITPEVTVTCTGGDVADLAAGDLTIILITAAPPAGE